MKDWLGKCLSNTVRQLALGFNQDRTKNRWYHQEQWKTKIKIITNAWNGKYNNDISNKWGGIIHTTKEKIILEKRKKITKYKKEYNYNRI